MSDVHLPVQENKMNEENDDEATKKMLECEEEELDESSGDEEEEDTGEGSLQRAKQALTCRKVTLNTLMNDGIIEPGQGVLAIDYLGQRFEADLLTSGKIKWHGSEEEFGTPSAWALHCKRLVNPIKRSGCGWASVKYKGRKLDIWKSAWARKHRNSPIKPPLHFASPSPSTSASNTASSSLSATLPTTATTATAAATTASTTAAKTTEPSVISSNKATHSQSATTINLDTSISTLTTTTKLPQMTDVIISSGATISNGCKKQTALPPSSMPLTKSLSALLSTPPVESNPILSISLTAGNLASQRQETIKEKGISDLPFKNPGLSSPSQDLISNVTLTSQQKSPVKVIQDNTILTSPSSTPVEPCISLPIPPGVGSGIKRQSPSQQIIITNPTTPVKESRTNPDVVLRDRKRIRYSNLDMKTPDIDMNTLVHCESFDKHKKLQPFSVQVSTNAMLLMDFHCHLTRSEVVGYLGGHWDSVKQILTIEQSYPILCRFADKLQGPVVEDEIRRRMKSRKMVVVGWYHSHPYCQPLPSVRDVDCQMAYQLQMRGVGSTYHPCIGFIEAPFTKQDNVLQAFWVMPNLENPSSLNIPMNISYSVRRDLSLTEDILIDMKMLSEFYSGAPDRVRFKEKWKDDMSFMEKIRGALATKLPEDQLNSGTFLDYMQQLLRDMK